MTNPQGVKCGNHNGQPVYHESVAEVRACYLGEKIYLQDVADGKATLAQYAERRVTEIVKTPKQAAQIRGAVARLSDVSAATREEDQATTKQLDFIASLLRSREVPQHHLAYVVTVEDKIASNKLSKREASQAITTLKAFPLKASGNAASVTQDGMYRNPKTGEIFKVQWNKAGGDGRALYAKLLKMERYEFGTDNNEDAVLRHEFVYVSGLIKKVRPEWRMTREEAQEFGKLYGVCVRCLRDLTDETSIANGIGPICAGKEGWQ